MNKLFCLLDALLYCFLYLLSAFIAKLLMLIAISAKIAIEYGENLMPATGGAFFEQVMETLTKQTLPVLLLSYLIFFLLCYIIFKIRKTDLSGFVGHRKAGIRSLAGAFVTGAVLNLTITNLMSILNLPDEWIITHNESIMLLFQDNIIFAILVIAIVAPLFEEFFFRGILYKTIYNALGPFFAVFLTSIVFALAHTNPIQGIYSFVIGVILGILRYRSNSIWSPIVAHISFNTMNFFAAGIEAPLGVYVVLLVFSLVTATIKPQKPEYKNGETC